jgi:hypothetical protein
MKWYAYPLALVAWLLVAIWTFIFIWNWLGDAAQPEWAYLMLVVAAAYIGISVVLSKLNLAWELDGLIQVAFVLGPLLWYLNLRDPYKAPVYVFLIEAGYEGEAQVKFTNDEATKPQVRSTADTLFFRFDKKGQMVLNEDFRTVRDGIENQFYFLYPDGTRKKIRFIPEGTTVQPDSTQFVSFTDSIAAEKGKIEFMTWKIQRADKVDVSR